MEHNHSVAVGNLCNEICVGMLFHVQSSMCPQMETAVSVGRLFHVQRNMCPQMETAVIARVR